MLLFAFSSTVINGVNVRNVFTSQSKSLCKQLAFWYYLRTDSQVGGEPVHRLSAPHLLLREPVSTKPALHPYVAVSPYVVPDECSTNPFSGPAREPQSEGNTDVHNCHKYRKSRAQQGMTTDFSQEYLTLENVIVKAKVTLLCQFLMF